MYSIYEHLHIFASKYRKYDIKTDKLDINTFKKKIQLEQYVTIEVEQTNIPKYYVTCQSEDARASENATKHMITIALISPDSKYIKSASECRTILIKLTKNDHDYMKAINDHIIQRSLFMITRDDIKGLISKTKSIVAWVNTIENYQHMTFIMEIPRGPHCSKHEILTEEEVKQELVANFIDCTEHIPLIADSDPQCIWIGAKPGNIVRIIRCSSNSGYSIEYRKVIPRIMTEEIKSVVASATQVATIE